MLPPADSCLSHWPIDRYNRVLPFICLAVTNGNLTYTPGPWLIASADATPPGARGGRSSTLNSSVPERSNLQAAGSSVKSRPNCEIFAQMKRLQGSPSQTRCLHTHTYTHTCARVVPASRSHVLARKHMNYNWKQEEK